MGKCIIQLHVCQIFSHFRCSASGIPLNFSHLYFSVRPELFHMTAVWNYLCYAIIKSTFCHGTWANMSKSIRWPPTIRVNINTIQFMIQGRCFCRICYSFVTQYFYPCLNIDEMNFLISYNLSKTCKMSLRYFKISCPKNIIEIFFFAQVPDVIIFF